MENKISILRKVLKTTNAAFAFTDAVNEAFGNGVKPCRMKELHKLALLEIEKDSPNMGRMDELFAEMEIVADENSMSLPNFPSGGIINKKKSQN